MYRLRFSLLCAAVLALAACGGGSGSGGEPGPTPVLSPSPTPSALPTVTPTPSPTIAPTPSPSPTPVALHTLVNDADTQAAQRFLSYATFGARAADILALRGSDFALWIDGQMALSQSQFLPALDARIRASGLDPNDKSDDTHAYLKDLHRSDLWWEVAMQGDDQLRQRVAYALSQIFVISNVSDVLFHDARGIAHYHDMLAAHAFGNFRDLLEAVTLHPMMGEYLSMVRNEKADVARNIRPDENYARELMQLFSIGLVMLNLDGSEQRDGENQAIPTYDQELIKAYARVFTGWMYGDAPYWYWFDWRSSSEVLPMKAFQAYHDTEAKTLLNGVVLPAGQSAEADLAGALDSIFAHSNVAPFISKQLIQRLVTSNPSAAYVARVADVFNNNGNGVKGDLAAVIKAILLDAEVWQTHDAASNWGRLKEPMLKVGAVWRAFEVQGVPTFDDDNVFGPPVIRYYGAHRETGQRPYGSPSVFNFYRPDYSQPGEVRDAGLLSPEFQILHENTITATTNRLFLAAWGTDREGVFFEQREVPQLWDTGNVILDFTDLRALAHSPALLLDHLNILLMGGRMSDTMKQIIVDHIALIGDTWEDYRGLRAHEALFMVVSSPEFALQYY